MKLRLRAALDRGRWHWITFLGLLFLSMWGGALLDERAAALRMRYGLFQTMTDLSPFVVRGTHSVLVIIDDEGFYGQNRGQSPMSPQFLTLIVRRLASLEAAVIAIDLDMRRPDAENAETGKTEDLGEFVAAINDISRSRFVVLPLSLNRFGTIEPSVLGDLTEQAGVGSVRLGLINLPQDLRYVPLRIKDDRQNRIVDSFALAIARAKLAGGPKNALPDLEAIDRAERPPMAGFVHPESLVKITTEELLNKDLDESVRRKVQGRAAIIGGDWNDRSRDSGIPIDPERTPVGDQPGVFVHASHAETLMAGRIYKLAPSRWLSALKFSPLVVLGLIVATAKRTRTKILSIVAVVLFYLIAAYLLLTNIGVAADAALPLALITIHPLFDWLVTRRSKEKAVA
jgi:CHASE2 domain-containing sensor protein